MGFPFRLINLHLSFALSSLILLQCGEEPAVLKEEGKEKGSDLRFSKFSQTEYNLIGKPQWELKADEAYIYGQDDAERDRIVVYRFEFKQYEETGPSVIKGQKADVNYKKSLMVMEGNVVYTGLTRSASGTRMIYDMNRKILRSDSVVKLKEGQIDTTCRGGIIIYEEEDKQVCRSPAGVKKSAPAVIPGRSPAVPRGSDDLFQ